MTTYWKHTLRNFYGDDISVYMKVTDNQEPRDDIPYKRTLAGEMIQHYIREQLNYPRYQVRTRSLEQVTKEEYKPLSYSTELIQSARAHGWNK